MIFFGGMLDEFPTILFCFYCNKFRNRQASFFHFLFKQSTALAARITELYPLHCIFIQFAVDCRNQAGFPIKTFEIVSSDATFAP